MRDFATKQMSTTPEHVAPDGSYVRELLSLQGGGMAHFELAAGQTSIAVAHQTVEEMVMGGMVGPVDQTPAVLWTLPQMALKKSDKSIWTRLQNYRKN